MTGWMGQAACRDKWDNRRDIWFPPVGREAFPLVAEAKAICDGCPVRLQCLMYALDNPIDDGIWGGLTRDERRAMRRKAAV